MLRQLRGILVFSALTINTLVWFVPIFLLAIVKLLVPIASFRKGLTRLLMRFGENWISINSLVFRPVGSADWRTDMSECLRPDGWYLVLSNHQTWVDILVLQTAFNRKIPFLKFFIKQELIWFPFLGIAWWALDMPFMKRYSASYLAKHPEKQGRDLEATRKACQKFRNTPSSVINFVEGTRFSEQKRQKRNSPYKNLLVPRAGGIAVAISSMGEMFDAVLDVTLFYPAGPPKFWDMCCGDHVSVKISIEERQLDDTLLSGNYARDRQFRKIMHRWLGDMWAEKDALLEQLSGRQPDSAVRDLESDNGVS